MNSRRNIFIAGVIISFSTWFGAYCNPLNLTLLFSYRVIDIAEGTGQPTMLARSPGTPTNIKINNDLAQVVASLQNLQPPILWRRKIFQKTTFLPSLLNSWQVFNSQTSVPGTNQPEALHSRKTSYLFWIS
ncbi:hypothetical protein L218DRAFT_959745 [Marasmius fiardii PR-910]|nr:hypothetical protein L218DRAFT_959745 [Marasmius fiardii PR-910]